MAEAVREAAGADPSLAADELNRARRELLHARRSALSNLRHEGVISESVFETLTTEIDNALVIKE